MTTVSAAITTYNRAEELKHSIGSIIQQTTPVDEILVIDDGSSDNTQAAVSSLSKKFNNEIRYIYQDNKGASGARNTAFRESGNDFVAFLDDDDIWLPNHIALFKYHIQQLPEASVFSGYIAKESTPNTPVLPLNKAFFADYVEDKLHTDILIKHRTQLKRPFYTPAFSASIISKESALKKPLNEQLKAREDIAFFWLISEIGRLVLHRQIHTLARQLDVSLLSLPKTASLEEQLDLNLERAYWSRRMFEYILKNRRLKDCPALFKLYGEALLGNAHYSFLKGDKSSAKKLLIASLKHKLTINQLKLIARMVLRIR